MLGYSISYAKSDKNLQNKLRNSMKLPKMQLEWHKIKSSSLDQ
jgi:hypothetical protein